MLSSLHIENLAIADAVSIDFSPGFNVLTGETGAGKSLLIKALSILSGAKVSSELIRSGAEELKISARFVVAVEHPVLAVLQQQCIVLEEPTDNAHDLLLRRIVSIKGRSQAFINDVPVTVMTLKGVASHLIDIFAQHETNRLVEPANHLAYIDEFLEDIHLFQEVQSLHCSAQEKLEELKKMAQQISQAERGQDYLEYRIQEMDNLGPTREDFYQLEQRIDSALEYEKSAAALRQVQSLIDPEISESFSTRQLRRCAQMFSGDDKISRKYLEIAHNLIAAADCLDDVLFKVQQELNQDQDESVTLESMQSRLSDYKSLMRKLNVKNIDDLLEEQERLAHELSLIETGKEQIAAILREGKKIAFNLKAACEKLTKARLKAADKISSSISLELEELAMKGASLSVEFSPVTRRVLDVEQIQLDADGSKNWSAWKEILSSCSEYGQEKGQFLLSSNPGEPLHPLQKIASGGEMARIMLAIKKVLTSGASSCLLVFDEIDTGISGKVAAIVGEKLKELSQSFQIICISHLPQVAVWAEHHLLAEKAEKQKRVTTQIRALGSQEREREIARLLSGADVTHPSLANARELLKKAGPKKNSKTII